MNRGAKQGGLIVSPNPVTFPKSNRFPPAVWQSCSSGVFPQAELIRLLMYKRGALKTK